MCEEIGEADDTCNYSSPREHLQEVPSHKRKVGRRRGKGQGSRTTHFMILVTGSRGFQHASVISLIRDLQLRASKPPPASLKGVNMICRPIPGLVYSKRRCSDFSERFLLDDVLGL